VTKPNHRTIGYDLRAPCAECPFRLDAPEHEGIATAIFARHTKAMEDGTFVHSCHRTDERSDYEGAKVVKGKIQHCVGAIIACEKSKKQQIGYLLGLKALFKELKGWDLIGTITQLQRKYMPQAYRRCQRAINKGQGQ